MKPKQNNKLTQCFLFIGTYPQNIQGMLSMLVIFNINKGSPHTKKSILSSGVIFLTGLLSKIFVNLFQKPSFYVYKGGHFSKKSVIDVYKEFNIRPSCPVLTYSNHRSELDDPLMWSFLPLTNFKSQAIRWVPATHDICFVNSFVKYFFSYGQCVPIIRGAGIYQPGMNHLKSILECGLWVHLFPEGFVKPQSTPIAPFRWGIGELFMNQKAKGDITVIPIYIYGMENVKGLHKFLKLYQKIAVVIGEPIKVENNSFPLEKIDETRSNITEVFKECLAELKEKTDNYLNE